MTNIAIVGDRMKDHQGISGRFFSSLGANNITLGQLLKEHQKEIFL